MYKNTIDLIIAEHILSWQVNHNEAITAPKLSPSDSLVIRLVTLTFVSALLFSSKS